MQQIYTCNFDNHDGQAIIGFCLNSECKLPPQCCLQCMQEKHTSHLTDCKAFQNITKILDQSIDEQKSLETSIIQVYKTIKDQIDLILKTIRGNSSRSVESNQMLKEQKYSDVKGNLEFIKQVYQKQKQNTNAQIQILGIVNDFEVTCEKLKGVTIGKNEQQSIQIIEVNKEDQQNKVEKLVKEGKIYVLFRKFVMVLRKK